MKTINFRISVIAIAIGLFAVSCGGGGSKQQSGSATTETATQAETPKGGSAKWSDNALTKQVPEPPVAIKEIIEENFGKEAQAFFSVELTEDQIETYETTLRNAGFKYEGRGSTNEQPSGNVRNAHTGVKNYTYTAWNKEGTLRIFFRSTVIVVYR